ncbi:outer membrane lipoprotein SlyB [Gammaproteobacteria bacterium]
MTIDCALGSGPRTPATVRAQGERHERRSTMYSDRTPNFRCTLNLGLGFPFGESMKKPIVSTLIFAAVIFSQVGVRADDDDEKHQSAPSCVDCGTVSSVQVVEKAPEGSGLGAMAGALAGGVLANKAGDGSTAATLAGVAGGALAGHYSEKAMSDNKEWKITVQLENGSARAVTVKSEPSIRSGERVRIVEGNVVRYEAPKKKPNADQEHEHEHD